MDGEFCFGRGESRQIMVQTLSALCFECMPSADGVGPRSEQHAAPTGGTWPCAAAHCPILHPTFSEPGCPTAPYMHKHTHRPRQKCHHYCHAPKLVPLLLRLEAHALTQRVCMQSAQPDPSDLTPVDLPRSKYSCSRPPCAPLTCPFSQLHSIATFPGGRGCEARRSRVLPAHTRHPGQGACGHLAQLQPVPPVAGPQALPRAGGGWLGSLVIHPCA